MIEQDISCDVCRDLIPLVKDGVASVDSVALVTRHVAHCAECKAERGEEKAASVPSDQSIIKKIRRTLSLRLLAFVVLGVALGLLLRVDETFVYNLFIMPVVGALLYLFGGKQWYFGPCAIACIGAVCQMVALPLTGHETALLSIIGLSIAIGLAYGLLALLGGGIAALFKYAFTRGETKNEKTEDDR